MRIATFLHDILIDAAKISPKSGISILREKGGSGNVVLERDITIHNYLINEIRKKFPTHLILSEEIADHITTIDVPSLWILDPLDGTTNAANNIPISGISVAYCKNGRIVIGGIYDLSTHMLFFAERNKGAFKENTINKNKIKLHVKNSPIKNGLLATSSPYKQKEFLRNQKIARIVYRVGGQIREFGSTVITGTYIAEGKVLLLFDCGVKSWDIAAVSIIVEEAGGIATCLEGKLDILNPRTFICGGKKPVRELINLLRVHENSYL